MIPAAGNSGPRRRRFLSILLVVLFGVWAGGVVREQILRDQRAQALYRLRDLGAEVLIRESQVVSVTYRGAESRESPTPSVQDDSITDEDLVDLELFPELQVLDLRDTGVTNDGLLVLSKLPSLHTLVVSDTAISDVGLEYLSRHRGLESLYVRNTQATVQCVNKLRQARPNLWTSAFGLFLSPSERKAAVSLPRPEIVFRRHIDLSSRAAYKRRTNPKMLIASNFYLSLTPATGGGDEEEDDGCSAYPPVEPDPGGEVQDEDFLQTIAVLNYREIPIHTFFVVPPEPVAATASILVGLQRSSDFWSQLATQHAGRYTEIEPCEP